MTQFYQKTLECIRKMKIQSENNLDSQQQLSTYEFFECLLYGKQKFHQGYQIKHFHVNEQIQTKCLIYIHQNHVQLLTFNDLEMPSKSNHFNLFKVQIIALKAQYQMRSNIHQRYLIFKQATDQFILTFRSKLFRDSFKMHIQKLRKSFQSLQKIHLSYNSQIIKAFIKTDINKNQQIQFRQLIHLLKNFNIQLNSNVLNFLKQVLKKDKFQLNTIIYSHNFQKLWKIFYCREQIIHVFQYYTKQKLKSIDEYLKPIMSINSFVKFMKQQQGQTQSYIKKIVKFLFSNASDKISFFRFSLFIMESNKISQTYQTYDSMNDNFQDNQSEIITVNQNRPLIQYYCYSSHNTYLTGNQLTSLSRVQRYLEDLQNGIRCVQIDVHDGANQPIVKHGYTLTSAVTFQKVIEIIKRFTQIQPNHTPIILSLQNHCNVQNQKRMAQILKKYFNQKILLINTKAEKFPTLAQCRGKIIIKGPGNYNIFLSCHGQKIDKIENTQNKLIEQDDVQQEFQKYEPLLSTQQKTKQKIQIFNREENLFYQRMQKFKIQKKQFKENKNSFQSVKNKAHKINQLSKQFSAQLLSLITLLSKSKFNLKNMPKTQKQMKQCKEHWQSNSFSQKNILKYYSDPQTKKIFQQYSYNKWFRSYPGGLRVNSSNYNPLPAIQLGVQIIALNTQSKYDINNQLLKVFFSKFEKICTGYRQKIKNKNKNLTYIQIYFISAFRVYYNDYQKDNVKDQIPPVSIEALFMGTQNDNKLNQAYLYKKSYTNTIYYNSFNPRFSDFNQDKKIKLKLENPQLGFLIVEIPQCGRAIFSLQNLKNGYRSINLFDQNLKEKQSKILCKVRVQKSNY